MKVREIEVGVIHTENGFLAFDKSHPEQAPFNKRKVYERGEGETDDELYLRAINDFSSMIMPEDGVLYEPLEDRHKPITQIKISLSDEPITM